MEQGVVAGYRMTGVRSPCTTVRPLGGLLRHGLPEGGQASAAGRGGKGPGDVASSRSTRMSVLVPDDYVGAVMSDLSGRRGRVIRHRAGGVGRTLVKPRSRSSRSPGTAIDLRSGSPDRIVHAPLPAAMSRSVAPSGQVAPTPSPAKRARVVSERGPTGKNRRAPTFTETAVRMRPGLGEQLRVSARSWGSTRVWPGDRHEVGVAPHRGTTCW